MTWTKLSDDFADDCARAGLSDAAVRTHVDGLVWTMRRQTGGRLDSLDVRRGLETADPQAAIAELLAAGFWVRDGEGYLIRHHMEHQPEPDVIRKRREKTAERVRRHRRRQAGMDSGMSECNAVTERVTRVGTGRVGTGDNYSPRKRDQHAREKVER
jgi:hypothetical protein